MAQQVNLKEILHPHMDILFVALNPPERSNANARYFSGSISYWNLMFNSDLITQAVQSKLTGEIEVFRNQNINYKKACYGVTDLCHDVVETQSSKVQVNSNRVQRILDLLKSYSVKNLCIVHSKVGRAFDKAGIINRAQRYGIVGKLNGTLIYEMPFHNASITDKHLLYRKLLDTI